MDKGLADKFSGQKKLAEFLQYIKIEQLKLGRDILPVQAVELMMRRKLDLNLVPSLYRELYSVNEKNGESFIKSCIQHRILQEQHSDILREVIAVVKDEECARRIIESIANQFSSFKKNEKHQKIVDYLAQARIGQQYKVLTALEQQNSLPPDLVYISGTEYQKISEKFPEYCAKFMPMSIFCDHLKSLPEVAQFNKILQKEEAIDPNSIKLDKLLKQDFIKLLAMDSGHEAASASKILKSEYAQQVIGFFSKIAQQNLHDPEILEEKGQIKLVLCFEENKNLLAYLLGQEGGLEKFCLNIPALNDTGCTANFSMQVHASLYQSIFADSKNFALYMLVAESSMAIINSGGDVIGGNGNFLSNSEIMQSMVFVEGLALGLQEAFFQQNAKIADFLRNEIGDEKFSIFLELAAQKQLTPQRQQEIISELLVYKVLENIPDVLQHDNLQDLCEKCDAVFQEVEEDYERQQQPSAEILLQSAQRVADAMISRVMAAAALS